MYNLYTYIQLCNLGPFLVYWYCGIPSDFIFSDLIFTDLIFTALISTDLIFTDLILNII